jgi:predicted Zn-dependent protease
MMESRGIAGCSEVPDAHRFIQRGLILHRRGCETGAIGMYRQALSLEPENTLARYLLGLVLNAVGQRAEAYAEWSAVSVQRPIGDKAAWAQRMARTLLEHPHLIGLEASH